MTLMRTEMIMAVFLSSGFVGLSLFWLLLGIPCTLQRLFLIGGMVLFFLRLLRIRDVQDAVCEFQHDVNHRHLHDHHNRW